MTRRAGRSGTSPVLRFPRNRGVSMRPFVAPGSIVRSIWGDADTILFVFAGSAAEFALNRAVDWLFYTGNLPGDLLRRLVSTTGFAREIAFADEDTARRSLERIRAAHQAIERSRRQTIAENRLRNPHTAGPHLARIMGAPGLLSSHPA